MARSASGQAQLGTSESSFDEGPDKLPSHIVASIPAPPAPVLADLAQHAAPTRMRPAKAPAERPGRPLQPGTLNRNRIAPAKKNPEGLLTAAR
ncbi:MAG TPA: hypothetical protein VGF96_08255 [Terracidiphilus sp.]